MYQEKQRFTQWWLWGILVAVAVIPTVGIYRQIIKGEPFGNNPMSDSGLIIFAAAMYALPVFFWMIRLDTRIDGDTISFSFMPFLKKSIKWKDTKSVELVEYGFVGGWGIKESRKYGTVYATGGEKGLAIEMDNGRKFVIGTQKEEELKAFLEKTGRVKKPELD